MTRNNNQEALDGIRVMDWTQWAAGPTAARMLADLGADVIHIEQPGRGDGLRGVTALAGQSVILPGGRKAPFEVHNRNKRSMTVNLTSSQGRDIFYKLAEKSDVLVTNFLQERTAKFGVDYATISGINPRIIYASTSIFGPQGPQARTPGWDRLGQAKGGIMATSGDVDMPPVQASVALSDHISALALASGILTALLVRERTGIGQEVMSSQLQAIMNVSQIDPLAIYLLTGQFERPQPRKTAPNPLTNHYKCKDGKWIMVCTMIERHWPILAKMIGMPHLAEDPKFANIEMRCKNNVELFSILEASFLTRTTSEWEQLAIETGDMPVCKVNETSDLPNDPQVKANAYLVDGEHPTLGKVKLPGYPFHLSKTPCSLRYFAPELGEHTEEILLELGYTWEEIERFKDMKAV